MFKQKAVIALTAVLLVVTMFSKTAFAAAWAYEQDFEGLTSGSGLSGQDSWTTLNFDNSTVVNTVADTGSQSVEIDATSANTGLRRAITTVSDDGSTFYISMRSTSATPGSNSVILMRNAANSRSLYLLIGAGSGSGKIETLSNGGTWRTIVNPLVANTWYRVGVEFDFTNGKYRTNVDGGTFSAWYTFLDGTGVGSISKMDIQGNYSSPGAKFYLDDISADYEAAAPATDEQEQFILFSQLVAPPRWYTV